MKIRTTARTLITAACALIALAASYGASRVGAAANYRGAGRAAAAMVANGERTDLDVFALNGDRTLLGMISSREWQTPITGYNIVRTFRNSDGQTLLFALNGNTGAAQTFALNANGSIGAALSGSGSPERELRCDAAEFAQIGGVTKLITQSAFTGMVRTFTVGSNGAPVLNSMVKTFLAEMEDKNLFRVYENAGTNGRMIGVNTWTGEMVTYSLGMQKITSQAWTRGWTSMDHVRIGDVTYRLLYKAAGDPYKKPGESGDQARRLLLETVAADGTRQTVQDTTLGADGGDYSSVRFVQFPSVRGADRYGILFYRRTTSDYSLFAFNPQTGLGDQLDAGQLKDMAASDVNAPPYIDVAPYLLNGKTCLAFVNADNAQPLGFEQAEEMGRLIHEGYAGQVVGYQFILAQSGRIFFSRAGGKAKLDHNAADEIAMSTRKQLNIGSVSKVVTAVTLLKLAEQNPYQLKPDLSNLISTRVDPSQFNATSWAKVTPVLNLLAHTSGMSEDNKGRCTTDDGALTVDCKDFFNATLDSDPPCGIDANGQRNCNRSYNNFNTQAARKVIEYLTGAKTSPQIVDETRKLWANSAELEQMTCKAAPNSYYYGDCDGAGDCFNYAGKSWRRVYVEPEWLPSCSSSDWHASSRELIEFMAAIRYGKALNPQLNSFLLKTDLKDIDNNATAVGWDPAWQADGELNLNKGGYVPWNGVASKAYVTRLPHNCDAVLQVNSENEVSGTNLVKTAFKNAVLGQTQYSANAQYDGAADDHARRAAINTVRVDGSESQHVTAAADNGWLKLKAFRAGRQLQGTLTLVTEKTANAFNATLASEDVAISDGPYFATASLGLASQLNLITWEFNGGQLVQHLTAFGPQAKEVSIVKVASLGTITRVVTAVRNLNDKLQLDVWEFNIAPGAPQFDSVTHKDQLVTNENATAIAISHLGPVGDLNQPARIVTAYTANYPPGPLQLKSWEVGANGKLSFKHSASFVSNPINSGSGSVAIDALGDGESKFFDGHGFLTTFIGGANDNKLRVVTWYADDDGNITLRDNKQTAGAVRTQAVAATTTVVTLRNDGGDSDGQVKLIKWLVDASGIITRANNDLTLGYKAKHVAATGNLVTAVELDPAGPPKVTNWTILK